MGEFMTSDEMYGMVCELVYDILIGSLNEEGHEDVAKRLGYDYEMLDVDTKLGYEMMDRVTSAASHAVERISDDMDYLARSMDWSELMEDEEE